MSERPTKEQIDAAEMAAWAVTKDGETIERIGRLLSAYERRADAFTRAATTLVRERDTAIARAVAAEQRAETAELAWTELHRAAVSFEAALSEWCDGPLRDALWKALAAKPTDLAEAQRRELRAEGMEEVAVMLERVGEGRSSRATKAMAAAMRGGAK